MFGGLGYASDIFTYKYNINMFHKCDNKILEKILQPYGFSSTNESRSNVLPQIIKNKENKGKMKEKEHNGKQKQYDRGNCLVVTCQKV